MSRTVVLRVHLAASVVAMTLITSFLLATVVVELAGDVADVHAVKRWIAFGLAALIPAVFAAGATGWRLGGRSRAPLVCRKLRRMAAIGAIGVLVLAPSAILLERLSSDGRLGPEFVAVQTLELAAGAANLILMALNFRDGLALRARRTAAARRRTAVSPSAIRS